MFIQEAVAKEINTNLDALLPNFPMLFKVEPKLGLCILLTLTSNPQFLASGIMSSDFLGSVVDCSSPQQPPFSPQSPLPDVVNSQMLQVILSDYVVNSAMYTLYKNK